MRASTSPVTAPGSRLHRPWHACPADHRRRRSASLTAIPLPSAGSAGTILRGTARSRDRAPRSGGLGPVAWVWWSGSGAGGYLPAMDVVSLGKAGLQGWRAQLADAVAGPIASRSRVDADQVQAVVGGVFFVLSVVYVVGTVRRMAGRG